jgi:DNA-directed RNA polymerase specialized sigma24 family protein
VGCPEQFGASHRSDAMRQIAVDQVAAEQLFEALTADDVTKALRSLPDEDHPAVLLADFEDFSHEEIAHILDIPLGVVNGRLHRARTELRRQLCRAVLEAARRTKPDRCAPREPGDNPEGAQ